MRQLSRVLTILLLCSLFSLPALAEDVCTVKDASAATHVTTPCSYLRVKCPLAGETDVTLTVQDAWGTLLYQRNYGVCSGTFRSSDIHLPLTGESCDYIVTLAAGDSAYTFTVTREQPLLTDSTVYAGGLTLAEMNGGSRSKYAVVLDLDAMNGGTAVSPMLAGGKQIGEVYFTVLDGVLTVSATLSAEGQIDKANVYVATDALTAQTLGTSRFSGLKTRLNRAISLGGEPYAAVMVQLTVTYDPDSAQDFQPGEAEQKLLEELRVNWQLMQLMTANEAVG